MDRLSIVLTFVTGPVLTGGLIIAAFSLGFYSWAIIIPCVIVGFALSWPAGLWISRRIKRKDRDWDHTRIEETGTIPKPNAPEV